MVTVESDYLAVTALQLHGSCWLNALRRCWWRLINFEDSEEQRVASCSSLVDSWGAVDGVFDVASNKVLNVGVTVVGHCSPLEVVYWPPSEVVC